MALLVMQGNVEERYLERRHEELEEEWQSPRTWQYKERYLEHRHEELEEEWQSPRTWQYDPFLKTRQQTLNQSREHTYHQTQCRAEKQANTL